MTAQDDFDSELDSNDIDGENFDAEPAAVDNAPPRKKRGGFLFFLVFLGLIGGGGYYAVKTLGIHVPYLNPAPAAPVVAATPAPGTDMAAMPEPVMEGAIVEDTRVPSPMPAPNTAANADPLAADPLAVDPLATDPLTTDPLAADSPADDTGIATPAAMPADTAAIENGMAAVAPADAAIDPLTGLPLAGTPETTPAAALAATDVSALVNETPAAPAVATPDPLVTAAPQAEQAPPPMPASAPEAPAANAALEARLHNLEQKLGALESMQVTRLDFEALRNEIAALKSAPPVRAGRNDADYNNAASGAAVSNSDEAPPAPPKPRIKKAAAKPAAEKSPAVTAWVLKSAKPGTAWVAQKGSSELKMVTVGSTLSGIGKVTSIRQNAAGKWVVNGSKGQINQ